MVLFLVVLVGQGGCYLDRFDRLGDLSRRGHRRVSAVKERPFSSRRDGMRFHNSHSTDSVVDVRFPLIGVFGSVARSRYSHRGPGLAVCEPNDCIAFHAQRHPLQRALVETSYQ